MVAMSRWNMTVPCQRIYIGVPKLRSDPLGGVVRAVEIENFEGH